MTMTGGDLVIFDCDDAALGTAGATVFHSMDELPGLR